MSVAADSSTSLAGASANPRRRFRLWLWLAAFLFALSCAGSFALLVAADQTAFLGLTYVNAISSGNTALAEFLGDHFSENKGWNRQSLALDVQRDSLWLKGAELSNVTTSREQTLSGQWVTMVRFKYRGVRSSGPWRDAALRVKTDAWYLLPYVRVVEIAEP